MSIINLALQSVGVMRQPMVEKYEKMMNSKNSIADIRECARKGPNFREAFINSLADITECPRKYLNYREEFINSLFPLYQMLNSLFRRCELKGKTFQTTGSGTDDTIHDMFIVIAEIDPTLKRARYH